GSSRPSTWPASRPSTSAGAAIRAGVPAGDPSTCPAASECPFTAPTATVSDPARRAPGRRRSEHAVGVELRPLVLGEAERPEHLVVVLPEAGRPSGHGRLGTHEAGEGGLLAHRPDDGILHGHEVAAGGHVDVG